MDLLLPGQMADASIAGGKGSNLLRLAKAGYNIPKFVIISPVVLERATLSDENEKKLQPGSLAAKAINQLGPALYAVRSSVCAEDGSEYSFAGQFKTILNVSADNLPEAIMEVYRSSESETVNTYKDFSGKTDLRTAVIVQHMVDTTTSGVAFGMDPINGDSNTIVINAVNGLGESLVSGQINADTYIFNRSSNELSKSHIGSTPVLNHDQINLVIEIVNNVGQLYNQPQDIEFAFAGKELFLLQSRPVTHKKTTKTIWDNSNIVESYPGITLPLTSSFLDKVYAAVYKQLCAVLGVSQKKIAGNMPLFDNLLGFINGRVYYNLNSWFGILALLPGYRLNAPFMEKMMGVKNKPDFDTPEKTGKNSFRNYLDVLNAVRCIINNLGSANKQRIEFIKDFDEVYRKYSTIDHDQLPLTEIWNNYRSFEKLMVERWKAPLVNDFFTMIYFGVLQKYCLKYLPGEPNLCNELIAGSKDIITTEPAKQLPALAALIDKNDNLRNIFNQQNSAEAWHILSTDPLYTKEYSAIKKYLDTWGERCVAELKMETVTYKQRPEMLIAVLQSYLTNQVFVFPENKDGDTKRAVAESKIYQSLGKRPFQRRIFKHVLSRSRYFISNRENLRYYRTRGFGMVREMILSLGKKMKEQKLIDNSRDIFYLRLDEIAAIIEKNEMVSLAQISTRKSQYDLFENMDTDERIVTFNNREKYFTYPVAKLKDAPDQLQTLKGVPCSPGIVQARVRLVKHAQEIKALDGDIMATYATDPGWVVLFPSASGILTERGSLLSHAAIVSREMGIPCIVGLDGLMQQLHDGDMIVMDGSTGIVNIVRNHNEHTGKS